MYINHIKTKRRPLYLKTQSVPRCKHFSRKERKKGRKGGRRGRKEGRQEEEERRKERR